jgi:5-carboxymethyl-2-hydroxymuconate isomerase
MPHIHLETTSDLPENADVPDILEALVERLCLQESVSSASVKAYHSLRSVWAVGEGHAPGIAHCTVMLLEGRNRALRSRIADAMYETLLDHFSESLESNEVAVTLELREMNADTYRKR